MDHQPILYTEEWIDSLLDAATGKPLTPEQVAEAKRLATEKGIGFERHFLRFKNREMLLKRLKMLLRNS
jgi:hypothetical protein